MLRLSKSRALVVLKQHQKSFCKLMTNRLWVDFVQGFSSNTPAGTGAVISQPATVASPTQPNAPSPKVLLHALHKASIHRFSLQECFHPMYLLQWLGYWTSWLVALAAETTRRHCKGASMLTLLVMLQALPAGPATRPFNQACLKCLASSAWPYLKHTYAGRATCFTVCCNCFTADRANWLLRFQSHQHHVEGWPTNEYHWD